MAIGLCVQLAFSSPVQSAPEDSIQVKELNFVYLHGMGGHACAFQLLDDALTERLPAFILPYKQVNPDTEIRINTLKRCYPGYADIGTWANSIVESIDKHFHNKRNLILVGHSMGGKTALYAVANNIGGLADKVAMVVTINSPVKKLNQYYVPGGGPMVDYCRTALLGSDEGVCSSLAYYDSSPDGAWVGSNKHWLAFISAEAAPFSEQYNRTGVDAWPRDMDDGVVPLSAQYSDGADVIYYGQHGHSEFGASDELAGFMAEQILSYIFGGHIECSVFARGGIFQHEAGWLPGIDYWQDVLGRVPTISGVLSHKNESYTKWQEWEDIIGSELPEAERDSYHISRVNSFPFLTSIEEVRWLNPDDPEDGRLYIRTRAAPRNSIQVNWTIFVQGLLPSGVERNHYEVTILTGTPLTNITQVSWATKEPRDLRVRAWSEAERPFRWFKAEWRVYYTEIRQRKIIDDI